MENIFLWLVLTSTVPLVIEGLLTALTNFRKGCAVIPALAGFMALASLLKCTTATGLDGLAWVLYTTLALSALISSLLGYAVGLAFRKLRGRMEKSNHETDETL